MLTYFTYLGGKVPWLYLLKLTCAESSAHDSGESTLWVEAGAGAAMASSRLRGCGSTRTYTYGAIDAVHGQYIACAW